MFSRTGHFWDDGEIEYDCEAEYEYGDGEVDPLDGFQRGDAVGCVLEEDVGTEDRRDDGASGLNGLCDVDTELCVPRGAGDCDDTMSKSRGRGSREG